MRTKEEILKKIEELSSDSENFTTLNCTDTGCYERDFSEFTTEETLKEFAKWLLELDDNSLNK